MSDENTPKEEVKEISKTTESSETLTTEATQTKNEPTIAEAIKEESEVVPEKEKTPSKKTPLAKEPLDETAEAIVEEETATPVVSETKKEENAEDETNSEDEDEIESSDDEGNSEEEEEEEKEEVDYSSLSKEELIAAFGALVKDKPVQHVKKEAEEIRSEFNSKFSEELEVKKEEFLAEGGNIIDFHHTSPLKKEFNNLYFDYKEKRNNHYKNLKKDLQANLTKRLELIEELKGLLSAEENINTTYNHFKEIQTKWHEAGAIPRDEYNTVWNTYHHHVENFYDFLHLNREFRDLDFKHNLEQKIKLIGRAEELVQEENINRAFRELQMLHKMWKEEIGPVAKEYRDEVWDKFSAATKLIHDKRQDAQVELEKKFEQNFETKKEIISQINAIVSQEAPNSHKGWQNAINKVQELRDQFFSTGKVPRNHNKESWNSFKEVTKEFNSLKNKFYKEQKKEQFTNLEKKRELIKIADENKDTEDFEAVTPLMKKIQSDWKKIGHVPRRDSDKIWKQFKAACNHYFERINEVKNEANKEEVANYEQKNTMLEKLNDFKVTGDHKEDLAAIKGKISEWKEIGRVPYNKRNVEQLFNKKLDGLFGQLDLGKKETELIKFENKINSIVSQDDERKLRNEHFFLSKKVDETKSEILQLQNNLQFFKHVKDDNPLVKEVKKNIEKHKEDLEVWKAKLKKLKAISNA
jgi:hypothetical protein